VEFSKLVLQIIKFCFVGIIAGIVDVGVLMLLTEVFKTDVLLASAISFSVSVVVNYLLSMRFVFKSDRLSKLKDFFIFVSLSIGGLFINQGIMWFGTEIIKAHYLSVKIFAMIFVPVYNFITRKMFLEKVNSYKA